MRTRLAKPVGETARKCRTLAMRRPVLRSFVPICPGTRHRQLTWGAVTRRCLSWEMVMRLLEMEWNESQSR
jgi:hypothetical protein